MSVTLASLLTTESAARILETGLQLARALGLDTTSWRAGDPARALLKFGAEVLAARDGAASSLAAAAFLRTAAALDNPDWLTLLAEQVYGVERQAAVAATSTLTLVNSGGGVYSRNPGEFTAKNSTTDATYTSTTGFALLPGETTTVDVVADVAGSEGSASADEIDEIVTTLLGVDITASTAAVGVDEESNAALVTRCEATLGALSPNGPPDAYVYVARNAELTGRPEVTRAQADGDSATGLVTVYIASAAGAVSPAVEADVLEAVLTWATPLCITPTVESATDVATALTATVDGGSVPADIESQVSDAYTALLAAVPIGGLVARSAIIAMIHELLVEAGVSEPSVSLTLPAADVALADGEVAVAGAVSVTEV